MLQYYLGNLCHFIKNVPSKPLKKTFWSSATFLKPLKSSSFGYAPRPAFRDRYADCKSRLPYQYYRQPLPACRGLRRGTSRTGRPPPEDNTPPRPALTDRYRQQKSNRFNHSLTQILELEVNPLPLPPLGAPDGRRHPRHQTCRSSQCPQSQQLATHLPPRFRFE